MALDISLAAAVVAKKKAESISAEAQVCIQSEETDATTMFIDEVWAHALLYNLTSQTRLQALERDIAAHEAATDKANNALLLAEQGRCGGVQQSKFARIGLS